MIKTQIQLPDQLYNRAKRFAAAREMSLAELMRRSTELFLDLHPAGDARLASDWAPPSSDQCGWGGLDAAQLKAALADDIDPQAKLEA